MGVRITIKGVPEEVRDELKARAALKGQSMQEYLSLHFERMVSVPSEEQVAEETRSRAAAERCVPGPSVYRTRDPSRSKLR